MKNFIITFVIATLSIASINAARIELSNAEKELVIELCSQNEGDDSKVIELLNEDKVYLSKNYIVAKWESVRRPLRRDSEIFPLYIRYSYNFVCAFNLETQEVNYMLND